MGSRYTLESAQESLRAKNLDSYLSVVGLDHVNGTATLLDSVYGEYVVDLKALSPKSTIALHKARVHAAKMSAQKSQYVGSTINGLTILDVFYGPDKGYNNRSFFMEYRGTCGHVCVATRAMMLKHKKTFVCQSCAHSEHGARGKEGGVLKKRTSTYNHWVKINKTLPAHLQDFGTFRAHAGDKPYKKAELRIVDGRPIWSPLEITDDSELNIIATAIRQAFRHSCLYKQALENAKVQTEDGTRYRCASCKKLWRRAHVQVDHINPISKVDGTPLDKYTMIDDIWTDKIQVLDRSCHNTKSQAENAERRKHKSRSKK